MVIGFEMFTHGFDALEKAFVAGAAQVDIAAQASVAAGTAELIRAAQSNFAGAHRKGERHVGGAQPNIVTGNLRRSILATGMRRDALGWSNTVGPTAVYGRRVELGMNGHGAYPYFGPAARQVRTRMNSIAVENWAKYVTF